MHIILGAGGTGRSIGGILRTMNIPFFYLDDALHGNTAKDGVPVRGPVADFIKYPGASFIVGYGNTYMEERREIFFKLKEAGMTLFSAIFPTVYIDSTATVGEGTMIGAGCIIMPNAHVGSNCILCVSTTIDHDSSIGDHSYLSPGVNVAGGVSVEEGVFIGTNAALLPLVKVGRGAIIGAGAVVKHEVPPYATVVGVPARVIKIRKPKEEP